MPDPISPPPDAAPLPTAHVEAPHRFRIPLVWIIPLVALLIGLFLAARSYYEQGPTITIAFKTGEGLEPGKTRIKYKDVEVGQISAVALSDDGTHVVATALMAREAARLLKDDTRFWVVSARVSGSSVSGLGTLLSGAYVGLDVGKSDEDRRDFVALDAAPAVTFDVPGQSFVLQAETLGSIAAGTPIYFRRIEAGQVTGFKLDETGKRLDVQIFIKSPYDRFVTTNSRFWNAGGVDVKIGADGVQVNTESFAAIMAGGIAFQTPDDGPDQPAPRGQAFRLFATRAEALKQPHTEVLTVALRFTESVRGLSVGAPVDFRGIQIGEVSAITPDFHPRSTDLGLIVEAQIYPGRMRAHASPDNTTYFGKDVHDKNFRAFVDQLIGNGLRGQLRSGNLVTGQLYVALDFFPGTKPARADWSQQPPQLPTQRGSLDELQTTLLRIVNRLDKLPLEDIGRDTHKAIAGLGRTVDEAERLLKRLDGLAGGEVRDTVSEARVAIADARKLLASDAPLQQDLRASLQELARAAQALRHLADTLDRNPEALLRGKPEEKP
ncbi:intermembrane transport protein PqiB [Zoogloea sp.]|uniref:PqiB family protein n=1 Tax=Zoogloea sp. TaxID=49181 RepID=UPI0035AFB862